MHEGIARQAERRHARVDLVEKRAQAIIGTDAEGRIALLATSIKAHGGLEGLSRIDIGRKDEEFKLSRHHRRQATLRIAADNRLELSTGGEAGAFPGQLMRIADRQCTGLRAPRQTMDLPRVGIEGKVAIITAIEARRRIPAHDALQQHSTSQLQAPSLEETLGGHYLATWYAIEVRCNTFNLINAGQSLR